MNDGYKVQYVIYGILLYLDKVKDSGQHDDTSGTFLPDHAPEIRSRLLRGSLCGNVGTGTVKTLQSKREQKHYNSLTNNQSTNKVIREADKSANEKKQTAEVDRPVE